MVNFVCMSNLLDVFNNLLWSVVYLRHARLARCLGEVFIRLLY